MIGGGVDPLLQRTLMIIVYVIPYHLMDDHDLESSYNHGSQNL
jgi:hypothetical protein